MHFREGETFGSIYQKKATFASAPVFLQQITGHVMSPLDSLGLSWAHATKFRIFTSQFLELGELSNQMSAVD
jgi:hypothetical protein